MVIFYAVSRYCEESHAGAAVICMLNSGQGLKYCFVTLLKYFGEKSDFPKKSKNSALPSLITLTVSSFI